MLTQRFDAGLLFASSLHRRQLRKATKIPYISHLLAVASLVIEDGGSEDEAIAALLHDAIEDCGDTYEGGRPRLREHIAREFGSAVLEIVNACTDDDGAEKGCAPTLELERAAWRERKQRYIAHIPSYSIGMLRVSCADKLHNLRSTIIDYERMGDDLWLSFRPKSAEYQLWYFTELSRAFSTTSLERLPMLLAREVETLAEMVQGRRETAA